MKYIVRLFTIEHGKEKFLKVYEFNSLPYIPHRKECLIYNDIIYKVTNICSSYDYKENLNDCNNEIWFEIMLQEIDVDREWWE